MNVDLTTTFKDSRRLLNLWKERYSKEEYPYKIVLNIFYAKYTIDRIWPDIISQSYPTFKIAQTRNAQKYLETMRFEINPLAEKLMLSDKKVSTIRYSDFHSFIQSASKGNIDSIKNIEYTYFLHRIFNELIIFWISLINSVDSKISAITKLSGAILPYDMPITSYSEIEQIFDQLGAEKCLQALFIKEMQNQL